MVHDEPTCLSLEGWGAQPDLEGVPPPAMPGFYKHLMVAPLGHLAELEDLGKESMVELIGQVRDAKRLLTKTISPHGFNVGMNFGRCAGAGLPGHLHVHVVPRWDGDTNFMPVLGDVRVIPQSIEEIYGLMREAVGDLGLPPVRG